MFAGQTIFAASLSASSTDLAGPENSSARAWWNKKEKFCNL
jgi:hypothetical protein